MKLRILLAALALLFAGDVAPGADQLDFGRDVRPVLSDKCFHCHGPDEAHREADLRLDVAAAALEWAIVPGDVDKSEFIARVISEDPELLMPPPDSGKKLTGEEIETLRRWVAAGAKYQTHWAFTPPVRPPIPEVKQTAWVA